MEVNEWILLILGVFIAWGILSAIGEKLGDLIFRQGVMKVLVIGFIILGILLWDWSIWWLALIIVILIL